MCDTVAGGPVGVAISPLRLSSSLKH
jgi:hypothetical protein